MHLQIAKTVNPSGFPVKRVSGNSSGSAPSLVCPLLRPLAIAVSILLSVLSSNCRMTEKTKAPAPANQPTTKSEDASAIHRRAIAIDMHADTPQRLLDEQVDISERLPDGHFDSVRAREGGLDAQFFSIWVEPQLFGGGGPTAMKRADDQIAAVRALAEHHPETWAFATSAADIRRVSSEGKMAALAGLEGGYAIDEKIENVQRYYQLGVRYMSPAWSVSTSWAGSSGDDAGSTRGLNEFGRAVVGEMNRLGMMVDVSHVSDKTFWDIVNTSTKPVIATHSGCRAIADVPRNLTDEMIEAIAKSGGVVNVIFYPEHLEPGWSEKKKKVDAEIASEVQRASDAERGDAAHKKLARDRVRRDEYARRLPPVSVSRLADHIDHVVKLVGIDYVGIGTDFDGVQSTLSDLADISQLPNLTRELLRRGYSEGDIDKILGGNMLRVLEAVEK
ncbi:MAG TPA: dipeptidase [Pyrinomonadaceae bacterium]|jgi:membrane dipeptidase|nr:dipeptidase [Pyrinomonadaceae bacterium]